MFFNSLVAYHGSVRSPSPSQVAACRQLLHMGVMGAPSGAVGTARGEYSGTKSS